METTQYTPALDAMRRFFESRQTADVQFRKTQLRKLRQMMEENTDALTDAIFADIHRSKSEGFLFEVLQTFNEVDTFLDNLDHWAAPARVKRGMVQMFDKAAYIHKDPKGIVLIICPWNYPVNLMIMPLIGAIGAGNCAIIKPSEIAPHTSSLLAKLIAQYFDPNYIRVIEGGVAETTELLKERFDHVFYTGAPAVGKIVMTAAAKHLSPVTLELGGKCPVIIDRNLSSVAVAARRIAWGKFMSSGQTCVSPDHIFCFQEDRDALLEGLKAAALEFYGENPQNAPDYSRIISQRHFDRLEKLLENGGGRVVMGGKRDRDDLYIEPTAIFDVSLSDPIMQEEIFGPIIPVITVKSLDSAIDLINQRSSQGHKPLALYIFSDHQSTVTEVLQRTSSGGSTINDVILHMGLDTLPFGGVGYSGMGRYHGKFSFDTFSHEKAVLHRNLSGESVLWMRYPPYNAKKLWWAEALLKPRRLPKLGWLQIPFFILLGAVLGILYMVPTLFLNYLTFGAISFTGQ